MAYMVGIDGASGRATGSPPKKTNPSSTGRPGPRMPDEEDQRDRQAYIQRVYGSPVSNRPEVQKALSNQYDYNKKRITQGKALLAIADVRWDPTAYDDAMNEWMDQRYQKTGKLPSGEERLDYFRDEAANKRRAAFESPQKPTEYQPIPGGLSALKESGESPAQQAGTAKSASFPKPSDDRVPILDSSKKTVSFDKLSSITDTDLEDPDIARYVLNARNRNTEASFPDWGMAAAKRIIQLFDPTWTPERQISDLSDKQRKKEALDYLNKIRRYVNSPGQQIKESIPKDAGQSLEAFDSGLANALSWGMLDNEYFHEAGQADPSARILGDLAGQLVPEGKIAREFSVKKVPALKNARKLALEDAQAKLEDMSRERSTVNADDIAKISTHSNDPTVPKEADALAKEALKRYTQNGMQDSVAVLHQGVEGTPTTHTRVGQWMSKAEYEQFLKTGDIPRTNVLTKGKSGYIQQANKGDYYVEFDVDSTLLVPKNEALGWSLLKSKNQTYRKLYEKKGLTLPEPKGTDITHIDTK